MTEKLPVACNNYACADRGERPRCYLDIYQFCDRYKKEEKKKNEISRSDASISRLESF